ncbi:hypothetical protein [Streptosporangium sp. NPDC049078]|uniref:hypothetical protein n=1 Tax=Streptosporangium sp. NPDC049078 TaxID=3155767 RepID=UPI00343E559C
MAKHRPVPFTEAEFDGQITFTVAEIDKGLVVTGNCPGCGARTSTTFSHGTPQGTKGGLRRKPPVRATKVTVYCECGYPHPERPPEVPDTGCGAYWSVDIG